ncbi:hypothetical protein [Labrenzia sp. THAF82]|uniref:hypothetical protein n=1 Tax=Labrenzia sp. THAF82 TaxID=2587861 RepID=UPI001564A832|nr:hypothetical protein [Labrenzia sp. THAF82]
MTALSTPRLQAWKVLNYACPLERLGWPPGLFAPQIVDRICICIAARVQILFMI